MGRADYSASKRINARATGRADEGPPSALRPSTLNEPCGPLRRRVFRHRLSVGKRPRERRSDPRTKLRGSDCGNPIVT
jgi:hypothetical protein